MTPPRTASALPPFFALVLAILAGYGLGHRAAAIPAPDPVAPPQQSTPSSVSPGSLDVAFKALRAGDLEAARRELIAIPNHHPHYPLALHNLGILHDQLGDVRASRDTFLLLTGVAPTDAEAWANLGWAQHRFGDFDAAVTATRRALELDPARTLARFNLALHLAALARVDASIAAYREALTQPDASAQMKSAIADLAELAQSADDCTAAVNVLAQLLVATGDPVSARAEVARCLARAAVGPERNALQTLSERLSAESPN